MYLFGLFSAVSFSLTKLSFDVTDFCLKSGNRTAAHTGHIKKSFQNDCDSVPSRCSPTHSVENLRTQILISVQLSGLYFAAIGRFDSKQRDDRLLISHYPQIVPQKATVCKREPRGLQSREFWIFF